MRLARCNAYVVLLGGDHALTSTLRLRHQGSSCFGDQSVGGLAGPSGILTPLTTLLAWMEGDIILLVPVHAPPCKHSTSRKLGDSAEAASCHMFCPNPHV